MFRFAHTRWTDRRCIGFLFQSATGCVHVPISPDNTQTHSGWIPFPIHRFRGWKEERARHDIRAFWEERCPEGSSPTYSARGTRRCRGSFFLRKRTEVKHPVIFIFKRFRTVSSVLSLPTFFLRFPEINLRPPEKLLMVSRQWLAHPLQRASVVLISNETISSNSKGCFRRSSLPTHSYIVLLRSEQHRKP